MPNNIELTTDTVIKLAALWPFMTPRERDEFQRIALDYRELKRKLTERQRAMNPRAAELEPVAFGPVQSSLNPERLVACGFDAELTSDPDTNGRIRLPGDER